MPQAVAIPAIGAVGGMVGNWMQGKQQNRALRSQEDANRRAMQFEMQKENQRRQMQDRRRQWANQRYGGGSLGNIMMQRTPKMRMPY